MANAQVGQAGSRKNMPRQTDLSLELVSLLKEQFGCCVQLLKIISDQDKLKAIKHITNVLTEFDLNIEDFSDGTNEEYFDI